jgi:phenylacetate-CoA ligase
MRSEIESAFGAHAFEEYGSVENCGLATECERGRLHVHVDFGVIEILRPDGTPAPPGEVGEIVQTGFANSRQIFIRYRVGDLAAWDPSPCACGRAALPVLRDLIGRQEDTVFGPDGREMVRFHGLFIGLPGVLEGQLIQETEREFEVKLVPTALYSPADGDAIRRRMHERLGAGISVHIVELAEIPREASGKFRAVISRVSRRPANTARS